MDIKQGGYIYFIEAANHLVKIGKTIHDPQKRLKEIQNMSPQPLRLRIVFRVEGDLDEYEEMLHRTYHKRRKHGEWFEFLAPLNDLIDSFKANQIELSYELYSNSNDPFYVWEAEDEP